jgi:glutathione S-transferase
MQLRLVGRGEEPLLHLLTIALMEADADFSVELREDAHPPVLRVDGVELVDPLVVCEFADEALDGPGLLPADPLERALARQWFGRGCQGLIPAVQRLDAGDAAAAAAVAEFLAEVDAALGERDFLTGGGGAFGLADLGAAPALCRLDRLEQGGRWRRPPGLLRALAWMDRVLAEPTVEISGPYETLA